MTDRPNQLTLDNELELLAEEDEAWEEWWASLPKLPCDPPEAEGRRAA